MGNREGPGWWSALAAVSPFPLFVGSWLGFFTLDAPQTIGALAVGTALGCAGLAALWTGVPGISAPWVRRVGVGAWWLWATLVGMVLAWWAAEAMALVVPWPPDVLVLVVGAVGAALVWWRSLAGRAWAVGAAAAALLGWAAMLPSLVAAADDPWRAMPWEVNAFVRSGPDPFPALATHIYFMREIDIAAAAAAVVLLWAPFRPVMWRQGEGMLGRSILRASATGTLLFGFMCLGLYVSSNVTGDPVLGVSGAVPHAWRPVVAWVFVAGAALWIVSAARCSPWARSRAPGWLGAAWVAGITLGAVWLGNNTLGVVPAWSAMTALQLLGLSYAVAPLVGIVLAAGVLSRGRRAARLPGRPFRWGWAGGAWVAGMLASAPGAVGFDLVGGGSPLHHFLPNFPVWDLSVSPLHPSADLALPLGCAAAFLIYIAAAAAERYAKARTPAATA